MPRHPIRALATYLSLAILALGAAACGDDGGGGDSAANADATPTAEPAKKSGAPEASAVEGPTEIAGGVTTLNLSGTIDRVLDVAGVDVGAAGDATSGADGLQFPIETGELDPTAPAGRLEHRGTLTFEAAGQSVEASNLVIEPDPGTVTAEVGGQRLPLLSLDMGNADIPATGDTIVWPATAGLTDEAAEQINQQLGVDVLRGGITLGDVEINAKRR